MAWKAKIAFTALATETHSGGLVSGEQNHSIFVLSVVRSEKFCIWALETVPGACGTYCGLGASKDNHSVCSRYQTVNCNLRMGWTFPRYRKVRRYYQRTRSVQVLAWNTAYLGHTYSRKMNSSWKGYWERQSGVEHLSSGGGWECLVSGDRSAHLWVFSLTKAWR